MIKATLSCAAAAIGGQAVGADVAFAGVSTDTRTVRAGELFVPLVGERFDGHEFVAQACSAGVVAFLWEASRAIPAGLVDHPHILVDDTLCALQSLARAYRQQLAVKVVAITGSNGKTSTKDMVATVLSARFRTAWTAGNLNNHIGLPLSILAWPADVEVAVLEMGMSGAGEIAALCAIARPDIGVITNIGEAHIGLLGSRDAIADAKWELIAALPTGGLAVLPDDEPLLADRPVPAGVRVVNVGAASGSAVQMQDYQALGAAGCQFGINGCQELVRLHVPGRHQARNALSAVAVAEALGITRGVAALWLADARVTKMRMELETLANGVILLNDAYNAAPSSVIAALEVLSGLPVHSRIVVLGDMLELGEHAERCHEEVGRAVAASGVDALVAVGSYATTLTRAAQGIPGGSACAPYSACDVEEALPIVRALVAASMANKETCAVLLKGSRRVGLERLADALKVEH